MKYLVFLFITFFRSICFSVGHSLTGEVLDQNTREPLAFANIIVLGKNKGTISNAEGYYVLDMEGISIQDTLLFTYVGYKSIKKTVSDLQKYRQIFLQRVSIYLDEVEVSSRTLTAREIINQVRSNYKKNYPEQALKRSLFYHKYERVPFSDENEILLKNSDFKGLNKKTFEEVIRMIPDEMVEYQDALVELYNFDNDHKIFPVKGISLEERSQQNLFKEMENRLGEFFQDLEKSQSDDEVYYKFRSGIFSMKLDKDSINSTLWNENKTDTLHYTLATDLVKNEIIQLLNNYSTLSSKNWEFIKNTSSYQYALEGVTVYQEEPVYIISFIPDEGGLYEGKVYVSTRSFAVLQLDYAFAKDKRSEKFQLFGFGHSMDFKKASVIFEKGSTGYYVKYISAQQKESASVNRSFRIMKKEKRFLMDKELNEIEIEARMDFKLNSQWELLVIDREEIDLFQFEKVKQPLFMKFRKEYAYAPEAWVNGTVIVPGSELKKYKRNQ